MTSNMSSQTTEFIGKKDLISKKKIAIIVAEWNIEITEILKNGALSRLLTEGIKEKNIAINYVPGAFELPLAAQWVSKKNEVDAIIVLGCIIKGDTPHFEYVSLAATQGILQVNLSSNKPVIFGVLTTNNLEQAQDRAGGKYGNKGDEAAITALKMLLF